MGRAGFVSEAIESVLRVPKREIIHLINTDLCVQMYIFYSIFFLDIMSQRGMAGDQSHVDLGFQ